MLRMNSLRIELCSKLTTTSLLFLLAAVTVNGQQINGTPGSPSATTTIDSSLKTVS
jgi:hypothetical protein